MVDETVDDLARSEHSLKIDDNSKKSKNLNNQPIQAPKQKKEGSQSPNAKSPKAKESPKKPAAKVDKPKPSPRADF